MNKSQLLSKNKCVNEIKNPEGINKNNYLENPENRRQKSRGFQGPNVPNHDNCRGRNFYFFIIFFLPSCFRKPTDLTLTLRHNMRINNI